MATAKKRPAVAKKKNAKRAAKKPASAKKKTRATTARRTAKKKAPPAKKKARAATRRGAAPAKRSTKGLAFGTIEQIEHFSASPAVVYEALMDGKQHAAFTGAKAKVVAKKGASFEAWDGYIRGKNVDLVPGERIVQSWRATDFPPEYPDSMLAIDLTPENGGTRLHLRQTQVPEKRVELYHSGWHDHYWQPLRAWLTTRKA